MPWTNWGEQINREEMLCFVKQIRNRCDAIIKFVPSEELEIIYTLLEDIYEDAQAVATGYSAMTEDNGMEFCVRCNLQHPKGTACPYFVDRTWNDTDCTGDE